MKELHKVLMYWVWYLFGPEEDRNWHPHLQEPRKHVEISLFLSPQISGYLLHQVQEVRLVLGVQGGRDYQEHQAHHLCHGGQEIPKTQREKMEHIRGIIVEINEAV